MIASLISSFIHPLLHSIIPIFIHSVSIHSFIHPGRESDFLLALFFFHTLYPIILNFTSYSQNNISSNFTVPVFPFLILFFFLSFIFNTQAFICFQISRLSSPVDLGDAQDHLAWPLHNLFSFFFPFYPLESLSHFTSASDKTTYFGHPSTHFVFFSTYICSSLIK